MKRVLVVWVNGMEETETIFPVDLMRRAGIQVDTVSITDTLEVLSSHNIQLKADKLLKDLDINNYDGVMFSGGPGYVLYEQNSFLKELVLEYARNKKLISAICAAPSFLAKLGILKNKKATIFKGMENNLIAENVIYEDLPVITDDNIITARSVAASCDFGLEVVEYLLGKEKRFDLEKEIIKY